ncbi:MULTISPECIES: hypothetical protein [Devosia]|uniref:Uncharacterized protein n=1 Tax=Devosia sediminis TaxID=2798801 RepID=A0A934IXB5_9HYPH|nr:MULTISPECIES: hypothetical protein [Devosia]MBJ3783644.1 hypothetical protein [Devosia sediminis]UYO00884.1 MAG: hypothetical protein KIT02_06690 [Devosia sp.]
MRPLGEDVLDLGRRVLPALIAILALVIALHQPVALESGTGVANAVAVAHTSAPEIGSGTEPLHSTPCCSVVAFLPTTAFEQILWDGSAQVAHGNTRDAADLPKPPSKPFRPPRIA